MTRLTKKIKKERGCEYCADKIRKRVDDGVYNCCKHNACPFDELDKYSSYEEFFKKELKLPPGVAETLEPYQNSELVIKL